MKSTITILTLFVAAMAVVPRPSYGQYAWVPVYADGAAAEPYEHASYVQEDLQDFDVGGNDYYRGARGQSRSFGAVEYLHWYQKGSRLPPLVSEGATGVNTPTSRVLFGGNFVGNDVMAGMRVTAGLWSDEWRSQGVVVSVFGSEGASTPFSKSAPTAGFPFYGIPFFNTAPAMVEDGLQVAEPGRMGTVNVRASNDVFGGDAMYKALLDEGSGYRLDMLAGYQYGRIEDYLAIGTISAFPFSTNDVFNVSNAYNAATLGLTGDFDHGPVTFRLMGKLGIGNMRQSVAITGNNVLVGLPSAGGFFAQPPNGGAPFNILQGNRDVFTLSPEVSAKVVWSLKDNFSISVGYTFLYWNHVAMAGDQIDRRTLSSTGSVNRSVLFNGAFAGGTANPAFVFRDTDFYVHTLDIGCILDF